MSRVPIVFFAKAGPAEGRARNYSSTMHLLAFEINDAETKLAPRMPSLNEWK